MYLGAYVKQQRLLLGMTAQELADKVNVGTTYISHIENLHTIPSPDMTVRIAKTIKTDPEWLIRTAAKDELEKAKKKINAKFGVNFTI